MTQRPGGETGVAAPGPGLESLDRWDAAFAAFHARFAPYFRRREVRERSARYVRGLLGPVERKNGWQLAEAIGERDPVGVQRLLFAAAWDAQAVQQEQARFVAEHWGTPDGIFVVDESGFVKKGTKSAGVQRQYSGTAGKVENCQIGVFVAYVADFGQGGHAFLDRRLYLPREWAADPARRQEAGVPDDVAFQTKPDLAWALLQRAWALGVPGRWVVGDTVYGQDPTLRARLEREAPPGVHYVLAVPATTPVWTEVTDAVRQTEPAAPFATRAYTVLQEQNAAARVARWGPDRWQRLTVAAGAKGPRTYDWAAARVQVEPSGARAATRWLLARRSVSAPTEVAYYLCNAPPETPLRTLAQVAAARWPIEQALEEAKGETGLDHYEVRRWGSWHRHVTLALLAHTFLADLRRQAAPANRPPLAPPRPPAPVAGGKGGRRRRPRRAGASAPAGARADPPRRADPLDRARGAAPTRGGPAPSTALRGRAPGLVDLAPPTPGPRPSGPLPPPPRRFAS